MDDSQNNMHQTESTTEIVGLKVVGKIDLGGNRPVTGVKRTRICPGGVSSTPMKEGDKSLKHAKICSIIEKLGYSVSFNDDNLFILDFKRKWEVGAIVWYDNNTNFKGKLAVKAKKRRYYHFEANPYLNDYQGLKTGDLVVFYTNENAVEEVYALRHVANFPWQMIFMHKGFYKDIEFDYYTDRAKTVSKHCVIPVIETCLTLHKNKDEYNLWRSFYRRLKSYETDQLKDDYISEVLPWGIRDMFVKNCLNKEYIASLQENDEILVPHFTYLVNKICTLAIEDRDLKILVQVLNCFKLGKVYDSFIDEFNALDDDWNSQKEVIQTSVVPECEDDCFAEMLLADTEVSFDSRSLLVLATLKDDEIFLESITDDFGDDVQSWLQTIPDDDFVRISKFLDRLDSSFAEQYYEAIGVKESFIHILLDDVENRGETTIERILKKAGTINDVFQLSSLLLALPPSAIEYIFRSYQDYPETSKSLVVEDLRHKRLNAEKLLIPFEENGASVADILSADSFFSGLNEKLSVDYISGTYWQYKELQNKGIISEISRSLIVRCISEESLPNGKAILDDLDSSVSSSILENDLPDSPLSKAFLADKWLQMSSLNYACIDIESDKSTIAQAAAVRKDFSVESYSQTDLGAVISAISSASVVVGHNIKSFDLPILYEHGLLERSDQFIWDTYEVEMALEPTRFSYALETAHTAKEDALFCEKLFWNQLYRICMSDGRYDHIKALFPESIQALIGRVSAPKFQAFFKESAATDTVFFREANTLEPTLENKLKAISGRSLLIVPKDLWAEIATRVDACYPTADSFQFLRVSRTAVEAITDTTSINAAILKTFVNSQENPLIVKLSKAIRVLIKDEELSSYVEESSISSGIICTDSFGVDKLGDLQQLGITDIYAMGYEIESRMNRMAVGDLFCAADLLKSDYGSRLVMQLSGASFTPVSRKDCLSLGFDNIPDDAKNLWMQKDESGLYQVYCNRIFAQFLEDLKKQYPTIRLHVIDWVFADSADAKITVVSTKKLAQFDSRIKRVNPASLYRSMYWAYQFALLEGIETTLVKILYITNPREIESLTRYAESKGYYIPEASISLQRRIELCKEKDSQKTLIIIGPDGFSHLRQSKVKYPYCLIWDNLDTDCLQVMWRGMLPFGDEPVYGAEEDSKEDSDQKKDIPPALSCILGVWPLVKYYCHQIFLQDENNEVCLLDPSFDDYKELEKSFLAKGQEVELWTSDSSYQEDLDAANKRFAGKRPEDSLNFNMDEVMATIWQVFVAPKLKGKNGDWTDIQRAALPVVFSRETNTLVSIPTGGGKSVLFQGAALYRAAFTNRLSIVVTPLKALMQDQVDGLHELGFVTNVEYLNSDKTRPETNRIYRKITGGEIALLYITPERFRSRGFRNALASRMQVDNGLEYIIFDEAHCISQWGLDFRPEYLSAAQTCFKFSQQYPDTKIELFSATVTGQVQNDIERVISSIRVIAPESSYNPIRNHIGMQFEAVKDSLTERVTALYKHITTSGFDPGKSRILVFCRRREDTQEGCELLKARLAGSNNASLVSISEKIGFFHAGMDTDEREYAFTQYKNGDFLILFATKAFGMGMDITNIHFVYHLYPPQFIEDYLQEVGRAGRNKDLYLQAGFNQDNPIPTFCFVSAEDFRSLKTLLAQNMLSWMNVRAIHKSVTEFVDRFQPKNSTKTVPIAVPDNIWKKDTAKGLVTDPTSFRLGLYWLERMNRIKMGYYASTTLDLTMPKVLKSASAVPEERLKSIYEYILNVVGNNCAGESIQIYINDICSALSIGQYTLLHSIIQGTKRGLFSIATKTSFDLSKIRLEEMKYSYENNQRFYVIDAIFEAAKVLLSSIKIREATRIDIQKRNVILNTALANIGIPQEQYMPWYTPRSVGLSKTKSYIQDISFKRAKFIFDIVDMLPGAAIKTSFDTGDKQVVQEVYLSSNRWKIELDVLKKNCLLMLNYLIRRSRGNHKDFVWADAIAKLNLPESYQYFCNIISILRFLGFIKVDGILSTGIEISLTDNRNEIPESPKKDLDGEIYKEFALVNHLKEIKFALMNAFNKVKKDEYDFFIKEYFKCETEKDYMDLLNLVVNENDPILLELQAGAIKAQEEQLDEQQRAIYDADIDKDINVLAGPGSGKTHVLTLRCARLVYHEKILPQNILVLAYNRAVVEELKARLSKLFGELGFGQAMSRLQIYTFHGLAKRYCHNLQNREVEEWEGVFLDYVKTDPGAFLAEMGNVQYILIDEFQDITQVRLDLMLELRRILETPVSTPRFFTIGDINQSIYGYEKLKLGQPMNPVYYYNQLNSTIQPETMYMSTNYRSYQGILDAAFRFVPNTPSVLKPKSAPSLIAPTIQYVYIKDVKKVNGQQIGLTWHEEFPYVFEFIKQYNASLPDSEKEKKGIKTIALFFRNNNEVYRGYARVRQMNLAGVKIRVQGTDSDFYRTRECNLVIRELRKSPNEEIHPDMKDNMREFLNKVKAYYTNWDPYYLDLTYALVLEYLASIPDEKALYSDLADYLEDIGKKDDGQLSKLYQKYFKTGAVDDSSIEIVLTTMHKVKGLEFDAVVVTPSYQRFGYKYDLYSKSWKIDSNNFMDLLGEERRLYFVAYSRAKRFLFAYRHPRELAIEIGHLYMPSQELIEHIGVSFSQGMDKLYINYVAKHFEVNSFIETQLKTKAPVILQRGFYEDEWYIMYDGYKIGRLKGDVGKDLSQKAYGKNKLEGLFINDISVWNYDDTLRFDAKNNKNYAESWSNEAKQNGFIYLVDFAGYLEL